VKNLQEYQAGAGAVVTAGNGGGARRGMCSI